MLVATCSVLVIALFASFHLQVTTRRLLPERQDLGMEEGKYTLDEFQDLMLILVEINRVDWVGGYSATVSQFEKLAHGAGHRENISSILEIGVGRGDFSILLAQMFPQANVLGIDAHELSVRTANENLANLGASAPQNVLFELRSAEELDEPPNSFDVITTTGVNHHIFPDSAFVDFLRRLRVVGTRAFVFNDLIRSGPCYTKSVMQATAIRAVGARPLLWIMETAVAVVQRVTLLHPLMEFTLAFPLEQLSTSVRYLRIFSEDRPAVELTLESGVASVERAFTHEELRALLAEAGYKENALQCSYSGEAWYNLVDPCRMACILDLRDSA